MFTASGSVTGRSVAAVVSHVIHVDVCVFLSPQKRKILEIFEPPASEMSKSGSTAARLSELCVQL